MAKANAELRAKFDALKAEHDATTAALNHANATIEATREAAIVKASPPPPILNLVPAPTPPPPAYHRRQTEGPPVVYPHKPGGCILVPAIEGAMCPNCGWVYFGEQLNDLEPHIMGAPPLPPPPKQEPTGKDEPLPPVRPPYIYADWECTPVPQQKGATCPKCGWTFMGTRPEDREPHPTQPVS